MSEENVEIVRRLLDAFNRLDAQAIREMWIADAEWRPAFIGGGLIEGAVFRGHDGVSEFVRIQADTWESVVADPVTIEDHGHRALVKVQLTAVGRASGVPVDRITWNVFELRDGKVAYGRVYTTEQEAREAVGLSQQATSQDNVEIVHRAVAAWNNRDIEAMLALTDPEVEYVNSPTSVEPGTRLGHESLEDVLRAQWEILSDARWEIDRLYERTEDTVGLGRISRQMPGSNARIDDRILMAVRFENRRMTRMEVLGFGQAEVREALEAAGLSE